MNILLVEDNEETAFAMASILETGAHNVIIADSVSHAYREIDKMRFDLLISDIELLDGTGIDIISRWRERQGNTAPSIAITGHAGAEDRQHSQDAGFNDYLTKPISFKKLERSICAVVSGVKKL